MKLTQIGKNTVGMVISTVLAIVITAYFFPNVLPKLIVILGTAWAIWSIFIIIFLPDFREKNKLVNTDLTNQKEQR